MQIPTRHEVEVCLQMAIRQLEMEDRFLLEHDINERAISHRLALYLTHHFKHWHVDCEYNRAWEDPRIRKMMTIPRAKVGWDDTKARTVYPDIVIHVRGSHSNLMVLELKKWGLPNNFDRAKLHQYQIQLGYKYAYLLTFRTGVTPGFEPPELV